MDKIKQVMVIDDDSINNIIFKKIADLCEFAEEVITFISAVDALDYLKNVSEKGLTPPNIIFLDIRMPIVNGWEFLDEFEEINPELFSNTAIYMLTSSSEQSDINRSKNYQQISDYIVKPLVTEKLREIQSRHTAEAVE